VHDRGVEIAVVQGAGNIYRGIEARRRAWTARRRLHGHAGDVLNALTLQDALERSACTRACSRRSRSPRSAEPYIRRRAMRHLEKGRVVIFAAAPETRSSPRTRPLPLRALEIHAEAILMAKNGVEGVYTADPKLDPDASSSPRSPPRGAHAQPQGDGLDRAVAVHGQQAAHLRLQHERRSEHRSDSFRRTCWHAGDDMTSDRRAACRTRASTWTSPVDATRGKFGSVARAARARAARPDHGRLLRRPDAAAAARDVHAAEARLLTVQPYDKSSIKAIERAIQESDSRAARRPTTADHPPARAPS
jgi:hypothetical protein